MHTGYRTSEDAEDLRPTTDDGWNVDQLIRQRRHNKTHIACGVAAAVLTAAALYLWSTIRADIHHSPGDHLSASYAAALAFAIIVGFVAAVTTATCLIVWTVNTRAAESDRIREHYEARQARMVREAIDVLLREGDASALQMMERTQNLLRGGEVGTVHRFRGRA